MPFFYRTLRYVPPGGTIPAMEVQPIRPISIEAVADSTERPSVQLPDRQNAKEALNPQAPGAPKDTFLHESEESAPPQAHATSLWEASPSQWRGGFRRIMAADDGSELSRPAVAAAESLAKDFGAELEVFQVRDRQLDPAQVILRHAKGGQGLLLILSTHGRQGKDRVRSGSVAEAVLKEAPCEVLLVKNPVEWTKIRRILLPLDGSASDFAEISRAVQLALRWKAECWLFHAQAQKDQGDRLNHWQNWLQSLHWRQMEILENEGPRPIAEAILETEHAHNIDLILISTHRQAIRDQLLPSSVGLELLRRATRPIWFLPKTRIV